MKNCLIHWRLSLATVLMSLAALSGCTQDSEEAQSENLSGSGPATRAEDNLHPVTGDILAEQQVLTYRIVDDPSSLDPQRMEDSESSYIIRDLFEGLLTNDARGSLIPGVARRYETSEDMKIWTFHLREDARWSDGSKVTAADFAYAWQRAVDPEVASPFAWYLSLMGVVNSQAIIDGDAAPSKLGVEAKNDYTFRVRLNRPSGHFAHMVTHPVTFPVPQGAITEHGDNWILPEHQIGNGAFVVSEHAIQERLVRVRNEYYHGNKSTILDKVVALVIEDEARALERYETGELDKTHTPEGDYLRLKKEHPKETHAFPQLCNYYYTFNTEVEPFDDKRVRKALTYAINREALIRDILQGGQFPAYTFTPEATDGFIPPDTNFQQMTQAERDQLARELLAEAGYTPDNPLRARLLYNTSEPHEEIALAITNMWNEKLAVDTTLENQDWSAFLAKRRQGDFEIARGGWCKDYNEASTFLNLMHSESDYNDGNYESEEYDRKLEQARIQANPGYLYTELEKLIVEDMPNAPIYHYGDAMLLKPYVKGWPLEELQRNLYSKDLYVVAQ